MTPTLRVPPAGVTVRYRRSYRRCGKPNCATCRDGQGHGPYWYAYWRESGQPRSRYMGRSDPRNRPEPRFAVQTLGDLVVTRAEGSQERPSGKVRQLLTYLLSSAYGVLGREDVADALWPDFDAVPAHQNLRTQVSALRKVLGDPSMVAFNGPSVSLKLPSLSRDDQIFEASARAALAYGRPDDVAQALVLYAGPYLPDDVYSHWTDYRRQVLGDLRRNLVIKAAQPPPEPVPPWLIDAARELFAQDPTDEAVAATWISLLAITGRRSEAVKAYRLLVSALEKDLGVEPGDETRKVLETHGLQPTTQ